jgi:hypothetical protein
MRQKAAENVKNGMESGLFAPMALEPVPGGAHHVSPYSDLPIGLREPCANIDAPFDRADGNAVLKGAKQQPQARPIFADRIQTVRR